MAKSRIWLLLLIAPLAAFGCGQPVAKSFDRQAVLHVPAAEQSEVTFIAVGDIMLSRGVARAISRANNPRLPFSQLDQLLTATDFNFGNLESPFSGKDRITGKGLIFNARLRDLEGLTAGNFKVLNLANNHALDQRLDGLRQTRVFLKEKGIEYLGVGGNKEEAWQPKIIMVRGLRIGFIGASYSSYNDGGSARNEYVARIEELEYLRRALVQLQSEADFIVVTMHAGTEYVRRPNQAQTSFARAAVDGGADLVIGSHPHWIQTVEYYNGRCIFYSLGNFIFDQQWSRETKEGLMIRVTLKSGGKQKGADLSAAANASVAGREATEIAVTQLELLPVIIENYGTPRPATEAEARQILQKIAVPTQCLGPPAGRDSQ